MKFNIGAKLLASFLVILILIFIVGFYTLSVNQKSLEEAVGQGSVFLVEDTIQGIDKSMFLKLEELEKFTSDPLLQAELKASNKMFEEIEDVNTYIAEQDSDWTSTSEDEITLFIEEKISNSLARRLQEVFITFGEKRYGYQTYGEVFVTNKYGALVSTTEKTTDYAKADEVWWQDAKENVFSLGGFEYDTSAAVWGIPISVRVDDGEGNFLGVIKALVPAAIIAREAELTNKKYDTTELILLTDSGGVIYKTGAFRFLDDLSQEPFFNKIEEVGSFFVVTEGGREKLFSYTYSEGFRNYEGLGWILLLSHDTSEVFAPLRQLRNLLLGVTGGLLLVILGLAFVISRSISIPVKKLTETAQMIASGDLNKKVEVKSKDEIGQLGDAFNVMTSKLKKSYEGLEEKVKQRTAQLSESNKLKDLFIDIMRHDLLNPAGVARTGAQTALMDEKDSKKKETLQLIENSSDRLIKMIENASVFAKLESGEKIELKEMDLGVILKETVEGLVAKAEERKIKIKLNAEGSFPAMVNPLIGDVIANFITNAIKYGPSDSEIDVGIKKENGNYRMSVADKGEGIPDKYKTAIFDRFTRLEKGAIKGTGLGLAIVKKIVELHNGKVWVEDNPSGGSVFIVEIPEKLEVTKEIKIRTEAKKEVDKYKVKEKEVIETNKVKTNAEVKK